MSEMANEGFRERKEPNDTLESGIKVVLSGKDISDIFKQHVVGAAQEELWQKGERIIKIVSAIAVAAVTLIPIVSYLGITRYAESIINNEIKEKIQSIVVEETKAYLVSDEGIKRLAVAMTADLGEEKALDDRAKNMRSAMISTLQPFIEKTAEQIAIRVMRNGGALSGGPFPVPDVVTHPATAQAAAKNNPVYRVIISAFTNKAYAERHLSKISATMDAGNIAGQKAVICEPTLGNASYVVTVGSFKSYGDAEEVRGRLLAAGLPQDMYSSSNPRLSYHCVD